MKFDGKTKCSTFIFECYGLENISAAISELNEDIMPFCYIIHDKDVDEEGNIKKLHAHFMLNYGQNTTLNHIKKCYGHLGANGVIYPVFKAQNHYKYLYHDQSIAKAKGKHVYPETDIKKFNGFDPDDLINWSENEKMLLMDSVMVIANDKAIYEYSGLLEYLSANERVLYKFCMNNTILINAYMTSHRHRNKKGTSTT